MKTRIFAALLLAVVLRMQAKERWLHDIDAQGGEKLSAWSAPQSWGGTLSKVNDGYDGKSSPELRATKVKNRFLGRAYRGLSGSTPAWGRKFEYTILARGKGEFQLGMVAFGARDAAASYNNLMPLEEKFTLSPEQWLECKVTMINTDAPLWRFAVLVSIHGEDSYVQLGPDKLQWLEPQYPIKAVPSHVITFPGNSPEITFHAPEKIDVLQAFDGITRKVLSGENGVFPLQAADGIAPLGEKDPGTWIAGTGRVGVWNPVDGAAADVFISRVSRQEWEEVSKMAAKIKLQKPMRILYLGDSLSDYDRGRNYTDKVNYWLNLHNPGMASFRNAGVGGDTIASLYNRLSGGKDTWRNYMYADLFEEAYDLIFIFLGHNDTRRHFRPDGTSYQPVEPDKQRQFLTATLEFLRAKTSARMILITPSSSDYQQCLSAAEPAKQKGLPYVVFGIPERLESYIEVMREIAPRFNAELLDLYSPMKNLPEKANCFTKPDGVHLSATGNHFIAAQIIAYLSQGILQ